MNNDSKTTQKNLIDLDLLSLVSHELKTPLATLKLNVQILQKQHLKKNKMINMMEQEIEWMIKFISDTLDVKQADNKISLNLKWHNWDQEIKNIESYLKTKLNLTNPIIHIQKQDLKIKVYIDSFYIKQVFLNLVLNAIEHSPKNSKIEIFYKQIQNNKLQICIVDEGCGIDLKDINKIFDPFYKNRNKTNSVIKGSGLGLTIVKKILEAHGENIYVSNNPNNKGTNFNFTLKKI